MIGLATPATNGAVADLRHRNALRALLVADSPERRDEVRSALAVLTDPHLETIDADPGSGNGNGNGAPPADVEMVIFDRDEEAPLAHLRTRAAYTPRPSLFALLPERSAGLIRRALRAGADEVLFMPLDLGEVTRALLKLSETRWRSERGGQGVVCSVTSSIGGIGVSTIAANLALALRLTMDKRVVVVDLDLQEGGLGLFLNVKAEHTITDLTVAGKRLDSMELEHALSKHPSGIYLLAAPSRIEDSELVTEAIFTPVLELMTQLFDYVVVDCGRYMNEISLSAWERSEHLFYVVNQSLGSIRSTVRFRDLFARLRLKVEPQFILNAMTASHPISVEQVSQTLMQTPYITIPRDEKNLERVQWGARDLWQVAPRSALVHSFTELATRLARGSSRPAERETGIMTRILGVITGQ